MLEVAAIPRDQSHKQLLLQAMHVLIFWGAISVAKSWEELIICRDVHHEIDSQNKLSASIQVRSNFASSLELNEQECEITSESVYLY